MGKWENCKLKDIAILMTDGNWIESKDQALNGIRLIQTGNIGKGMYLNKNDKAKYISEQTFKALKCTEIFANDIIVSRLPEPVGRACIIPNLNSRMITAVDCTILRVDEEKAVIPYVHFFLQSSFYYGQLSTLIFGTTRNRISRKNLEKTVIPLPPLDEQKRIAKNLDLASEIVKGYKEQLAQLDKLVQSVFYEMFGDPVTNEKGWAKHLWKAVFNTTTGKLDSNAMVENGEYPFFTCAKEQFWIDKYAFDCEALLLAGNNAAGIYDVKHYKGKFNAYQRTYVLTLKNSDHRYSLFKFQLENKLQLLKHQSKGTNTRYLTMGILNELDFIIPPLPLQTRFASIVTEIETQKTQVQQALTEAENLFHSLMQEYFE